MIVTVPATRIIAATTRSPALIAWVKASTISRVTSGSLVVARAAATVVGPSGPRAAAGSRAVKRALTTLPTTATPRALPSSRVTLCSPDPRPDCSDVSVDMMQSDSDGVATPQPAAISTEASAYQG